MIKFSLSAGALVLILLAIAGCGGDDGGDETTAPAAAPVETPASLTKEELIAQGDAICAEVNAAVGSVASSDGGTAQAADLYSGMVERLKDLGAPSDDTSGYDEFIAAAEALAQAEGNVGLAAERGEEEGLSTAEAEAASALSSFQSAATSFGFQQCSEGPSAPVPGAAAGGASAEEPVEGTEEEAAPEAEEEVAPETGGAGSAEGGEAGGGATAGGGTEGGGEAGGGEEGSGGIGPG
jgi:hypothetical protein